MSEDIHEFQEAFLASDTVFAEADLPVLARWEHILKTWAPARGSNLWGQLDDALNDVYLNGTGYEVSAALDFIMLRYRFIEHLYDNSIGRRHVNIWWMEATAAWRNRLMSRSNQLDPYGRYEDDDGEVTITPPASKAVGTPGWLH